MNNKKNVNPLGVIPSMSEMDSFKSSIVSIEKSLASIESKVSEQTEFIHKLDKQQSLTQSHIKSERGNIDRKYGEIEKDVNKLSKTVYGDGNGNKGLNIKIDRLEQDKEKQKTHNKYLWSAITTAAVAAIGSVVKHFM